MLKERLENIKFGQLAILCYIFTVVTAWSYGNSYVAYVVVSVLMAIFAYSRFFSKGRTKGDNIQKIITLILFTTIILSVLNGDLKSSIMVNISLLMPLSLATLNIQYENFNRQVVIASLVNLVIIYILISGFGVWNSNVLAFMVFSGISVGMLWFKTAENFKSRVFSIFYLFLATSLLLLTGCRNAGMVIIACFILLLIPNRVYNNGGIFRGLYIGVLFMTIIAADFMLYVLSDANAMETIQSFTSSFSHKAWGMDTHYILLESVKRRFANMDILTQLFGSGIKTIHTHNLFYQCLYFYGYIGTLLIYLFYIYVFERAYKMIRQNEDVISLGCYIILIGHFMLQIGEVYMLGAETVNLMSLLPSGVILQRWYTYKNAEIEQYEQ